ncbi:MAG: exodeoxyribonuclease V subunit gamma [Deltaproteobacteria bacterium]|nr:exodeoxyribonuclease V subunit gamma [Deltaproteobacteria bacterium]
MENLRRVAIQWVLKHPLAPLENEVFIVQSNGMAQWLKLALAENDGCGISAAVSFQLTARFLWQAYRAILGPETIPKESPYDKEPLKWRLFRLLKGLSGEKEFSAIGRFLSDDPDSIKRYQLADRLADLYDQYQVYRADWLEDWTFGRDQLRNAHGKPKPLSPEQRWQAELWRLIQSDVPAMERDSSRSSLHRRFLKAARSLPERPVLLPRRVIVFGVSTLPKQALEALYALSRHSQVLFFVHNPCRHYWADIIEDRELLRIEPIHHPSKAGGLNTACSDPLHQRVNPLLASWGKQGRDYIGLLYGYDAPAAYRESGGKIDLFDDFAAEKNKVAPLLSRVQQAILDLTPLPGADEQKSIVSPADGSITFKMAYSRQREVEILQDQLLDWFKQTPDLTPKDIIVMAPDIEAYTPHIESVFGNVARQDPRFIPFAIADRPDRAGLPLLRALEKLLYLPTSRMAQNDILDLLQVPAFRHRLGLEEHDVQKLQLWIDGAGIRWGLDAAQRTAFDLPRGMEENTWQFGLRRMLLGYAVGAGESWREIEPYDEIGGLEADLIGALHLLLSHLEKHGQALKNPALPQVWHERILALLNDFLLPIDSADQLSRRLLEEILAVWRDACVDAGLEEPLTLAVVRDVLLSTLKNQSISQRFLVGRVNFCTLMPMRAIPFKGVCLLGMNDGEYPRGMPPMDFDLMAVPGLYRPGDRSRREDDRYLFLEALLSARENLSISYVARDVNDNSERMPSVLVSQLRDYLAGGWQIDPAPPGEKKADHIDLLDHLTCLHPLQPFSKAYFLPHGPRGLFTHAREWRKMLDPQEPTSDQNRLGPASISVGPGLIHLIRCLKNPVKCFFNDRLNVYFDDAETMTRNREPFALDGLSPFNQGKILLNAGLAIPASEGPEAVRRSVHSAARRLQHTGELPPGGFGPLSAQKLAGPVLQMLDRHHRLTEDYPYACPPVEIRFPIRMDGCDPEVLEDWLDGLRVKEPDQSASTKSTDYARWEFYPNDILDKKGGVARPDSLVALWVKHLAGCAQGITLTSILVAPDGLAELLPLDRERAGEWLADMMAFWWRGLQQPLPVTAKTALAYLKILFSSEGDDVLEKARAAARKAYEGDGYHFKGELGYGDGVYLKRCYPDFDALWQADQHCFKTLAEGIYGPLVKTL